MLEGINVLSQTEIMALVEWVKILNIICLIFILINIILLIAAVDTNTDWIGIISFILLIISFLTFLIVNVISPKQPTGKYEYKVTIEDNIPFTEFYEQYEIIEQEGKIYTIREKE